MTPAIEGPTKAIKGADHKRPTTHWQMAPGKAWKLTPDGNEAVPVTKDLIAKAEYTFCLAWIRGATAAVFKIGNHEYAQPTEAIKEPARSKRQVKSVEPGRVSPDPGRSEAPRAEGKARRVKRVRAPLTLSDW